MALSFESLESRRCAAAACDNNEDGVCNAADATLFYSGGSIPFAINDIDLDDDGTPDSLDKIWGVIGLTPGDFTGDGMLNSDDYAAIFRISPDIRHRVEAEYWKALAPPDELSVEQIKWLEAEERASLTDVNTPYQLARVGVDLFADLRGADDRHFALQAFSYADGDVNGDRHFDSSDLVALGQHGVASQLDTAEIVRVFQLGTYES